jgi:hypothetical protein
VVIICSVSWSAAYVFPSPSLKREKYILFLMLLILDVVFVVTGVVVAYSVSVCLQTGRPGDRGSIPGRGNEFFLWPLCPDQL